jgi:hypothetical protein
MVDHSEMTDNVRTVSACAWILETRQIISSVHIPTQRRRHCIAEMLVCAAGGHIIEPTLKTLTTSLVAYFVCKSAIVNVLANYRRSKPFEVAMAKNLLGERSLASFSNCQIHEPFRLVELKSRELPFTNYAVTLANPCQYGGHETIDIGRGEGSVLIHRTHHLHDALGDQIIDPCVGALRDLNPSLLTVAGY